MALPQIHMRVLQYYIHNSVMLNHFSSFSSRPYRFPRCLVSYFQGYTQPFSSRHIFLLRANYCRYSRTYHIFPFRWLPYHLLFRWLPSIFSQGHLNGISHLIVQEQPGCCQSGCNIFGCSIKF